MTLTSVRSIDTGRRWRSEAELDDFEQELVDQYALAGAGSGLTDGSIASERAAIVSFARFMGRHVWTATVDDADRFLTHQRKTLQLAKSTVKSRAGAIGRFFDFLIVRYQGDIHAIAGHVVTQPIDEFNRPARVHPRGVERIPPRDDEVDAFFEAWGAWLPSARKYLPAARDYLAASLWRRAGLRISETVMLDIRDWHPDLGERGKLHVRFGKGSMGRGPKVRLVPAINSVDSLLDWWFTDVRHQFGDDYSDPDAPLLPSERRNRETDCCFRAGHNALRSGLATAVSAWLPEWNGRLSPHVLRHYCASSLYMQGMGLKAIQDLLGHEWLSTTTGYIHVHDTYVEEAWAKANNRVAARLTEQTR